MTEIRNNPARLPAEHRAEDSAEAVRTKAGDDKSRVSEVHTPLGQAGKFPDVVARPDKEIPTVIRDIASGESARALSLPDEPQNLDSLWPRVPEAMGDLERGLQKAHQKSSHHTEFWQARSGEWKQITELMDPGRREGIAPDVAGSLLDSFVTNLGKLPNSGLKDGTLPHSLQIIKGAIGQISRGSQTTPGRISPNSLSDTINELESEQESVRNNRQKATTAFHNIDQKANQFYNLLASVMKAMNEIRMGAARNIL
jgi:methyl-accepting chemotaxis protein